MNAAFKWDDLLHDVVTEITFMEWALVVGVLFLAVILVIAHFSKTNPLDLSHLIADPETGKIDRWSFVGIGGWTFLTWAFVKLGVDGKLDMWFFLFYGLMCLFPKVVAQVAPAYLKQRMGITSTTVEETERTEIKTEVTR